MYCSLVLTNESKQLLISLHHVILNERLAQAPLAGADTSTWPFGRSWTSKHRTGLRWLETRGSCICTTCLIAIEAAARLRRLAVPRSPSRCCLGACALWSVQGREPSTKAGTLSFGEPNSLPTLGFALAPTWRAQQGLPGAWPSANLAQKSTCTRAI